ncbi:MAG: substrate-binding domain-containing protein [Fimbriimonas sp.]
MKAHWIGLLALACVFGCAPKEEANTSPGTPSDTGKKLSVVYIPKNTGNPYFNDVNRGFEEACKEVGADFTTVGPASAEATSQIPIIKEQIQRGVDVIAISANSKDALNPVLDQAKAKGIVVITVDSDLTDNESHRDACTIPTDFSKIGEGQVALLGKLIGNEGEIAILSATTDATNQNAWIEKMKEELKKPEFSKMKLVEIVYGDDEPQKSTTECEALLTKHPNLRGIISPTTVGVAAAAQVLEQRGVYAGGPKAVGKGVELTGLGTPDQMRRFVESGVVKAFQLWAPYNEGFLAAYIGTQMKQGKLKPAAGMEIDVPKLGKRTFTEKLELVGSPLVTFDKKNIGEYHF